jgi:hypothetical protein
MFEDGYNSGVIAFSNFFALKLATWCQCYKLFKAVIYKYS